MHKKFSVAIATVDRRVHPAVYLTPSFEERSAHLVANPIVNLRVGDHAVPSRHLDFARLKLWFDQQHQRSTGYRGADERSQHAPQRDERQIRRH